MNALLHKARTRALAGLVGFTFFGFAEAQITITARALLGCGLDTGKTLSVVG